MPFLATAQRLRVGGSGPSWDNRLRPAVPAGDAEGRNQMVRALLILALALPAAARAEDLWRWRDAAGRLHYSNVPDHAPSGAAQIGGGIGVLPGSVDDPDAKEIQDSLAEFERIHQQRAITRRLEEIQAFQNGLRIRQRERLLE